MEIVEPSPLNPNGALRRCTTSPPLGVPCSPLCCHLEQPMGFEGLGYNLNCPTP